MDLGACLILLSFGLACIALTLYSRQLQPGQGDDPDPGRSSLFDDDYHSSSSSTSALGSSDFTPSDLSSSPDYISDPSYSFMPENIYHSDSSSDLFSDSSSSFSDSSSTWIGSSSGGFMD